METYLKTLRHYCAPDESDMKREEKVLKLLRESFDEWQSKGYLPSHRIEHGYNTDQPIRERGWTHWHHLFTPRQLLMGGSLAGGSEKRRREWPRPLGVGAPVRRACGGVGPDVPDPKERLPW